MSSVKAARHRALGFAVATYSVRTVLNLRNSLGSLYRTVLTRSSTLEPPFVASRLSLLRSGASLFDIWREGRGRG